MASNVFPAIIKATYDPSGGFPKMVQDAQNASSQIKRQFESDFGQIANLAKEALSLPRNSGGSLDLNVDEYRQAAQAARAHAIALREIATAAATAQKATGDTTRATQTYVQAANAAAREAEQQAQALNATAVSYERLQAELNKTRSATDAVIGAAGRGTTAYQANTQSVRAMRQATTQAGQQLQDIVISMGSGQRASTVLAQQLPQLAFAFSDVGGKVGSVARFLAGPWGVAVAIGAFALGPLIDGLFKTEDATKSATKSNYDFANSFDVTKIAVNEVAGAMAQLNQQITGLIEGNKLLADSAMVAANTSLNGLESQLSKVDAQIAAVQSRIANNNSGFGFGQLGNVPLGLELNKLKEKRGTIRQDVADARENVVLANLAVSQNRVTESTDRGARALGEYNRELARLNKLREQGLRNELGDENGTATVNALDAQLSGAQSISAAEYEKGLRAARDRLAASKKKPDRGAAAREAARVEFGEDAGKRIANIAEQFGEAPRLITQTNKALRELDDIQSDIERRENLRGKAGLLAEVSKARAVIGNVITTDFAEQSQQLENQLQIQRLILAGRSEEAQVVERIQQLEERYGLGKSLDDMREQLRIANEILATEDATAEERKGAEATVKQLTPEYERQLQIQRNIYDTVARQTAQEIALNDAIDKRNQSVARYQSVVDGTYRSLEDLLSGGKAGDFVKSLRDQFKQLAGQNLAESLFGDTFRELRKLTERNNPQNIAVERLVETTNKSSDALKTFVDALVEQGGRIGAANDNEYTGVGGLAGPTFGGGSQGQPGGQLSLSSDIVVTGDLKKAIIDAGKYNYGQFAGATAKAIVDPLLLKLDEKFGVNFFAQFSGVLTGALAGYARAGNTGAVLGGTKSFVDKLAESAKGQGKSTKALSAISEKLGTALGGAQTGDQTAQLLRSFGVKTSRMGGQVGGAIGSVVGGPIGEIVGSVIGSVVGGMLKKTKKGSTTISSVTGDLAYTGSGSLQKGVLETGGKVQTSLANIIQQLNGTAGAFSVSIGQRGKDFVVDPTGQGRTKGSGVQKFKTEEEASRAALLDAIKDGAVKGIKDGAQRLLQAGKDLDAQLQKAMKFQNVFDRLDAIKDPIGSVIRTLNREFTGLISIFNEAGASAQEFAALEELYGLERAKAIKDTSESLTGSLRGLIDELTKGDNGLSLRDRLSNIRADFDPMANTIRSGGTVDYDKFSEVARELIDVQRQVSGSQTDYFSTFDEVLALSRQALAGQENIVSIGSGTASPFSGSAAPSNASVPVVNAINAQTGELMAGFAALTAQVAQLRVASGGGGGGNVEMFNRDVNYF